MDEGITKSLPQKTKVAVVSPGLLPIPPILGGSVETVIQKMAESTRKKCEVDIFGPSHRALPPEQTAGGIRYYRFPTKPYSAYFQAVRDRVNAGNYSIVQVENRPLFIPKTKAANPSAKFICSLHSMIHTERNMISPRLTEKIFGMCDKVLVYSRFMRDRFTSMFPSVGDKFCFIHLATDTDRFKPRWEASVEQHVLRLKKKHGIPPRAKVILFAGRVIPKKGVDVLISALKHVLKDFPNCFLIVVGSGWYGSRRPSPYIHRLRQLCGDIAGKIRFTNYVSCEELPLYFSMADVFVCPSQWDEPFGLVNVEAMAAGVPVVASARGGIPEIVKDGINGFLVKREHDPAAFAKPMLDLLTHPEMARTLGINGRKKAEDYFNWPRAGSEMLRLYEKLLK